jgi:Asp-tRNA(Asn)/Glu-tRNA(Gln) amidotransferase A subunit family amidase
VCSWESILERASVSHQLTRRVILRGLAGLGVGTIAFQRALAQSAANAGTVTPEMIAQAQWIAGTELTAEEQADVAKSVEDVLKQQSALRAVTIDADTSPAFAFVPHHFIDMLDAAPVVPNRRPVKWRPSQQALPRTTSVSDMAFWSIAQQARALRSGRTTSMELTKMYLARLRKYDPLLRCVISFTEDLALEQATKADKELASGVDRGPLHGIPWGAKDLIAVPPYKTTWGGSPFKDQVQPNLATVAQRLFDAGAVLIAKLSLGTMAWGDVWHDATTRNPWNPKQGSSGSSAGSSSAVAAGLCSFAIGSETLGSIVSPCRRCRTTGLRPSFGRVSRYGCMALAWSMDKIGPIARNAEDCALVFAAIHGRDGKDPTVIDRDFDWPVRFDPTAIKIGVVEGQIRESDQIVIDLLCKHGATVQSISYPDNIPEGALASALGVEAATMFDDLVNQNIDDKEIGMWGPTFRESQWVRAIHYVRGMRARSNLITETEKVLRQVDLVIGSEDLLRTNLSGHPSMVVSFGSESRDDGTSLPRVTKLTSRFCGEATLLAAGDFIQRQLPVVVQPSLDKFLELPEEPAADDVD